MGTSSRTGTALALSIALLALTSEVAGAAKPVTGTRDPGREGISHVKWKQLGRILRPRNTVTLARLARFEQLDLGKINQRRAALGQPEVAAVLLDVDETIAPHHGPISGANKQRIRGLLASGVTVAIYSNASDKVTQVRADDLDELRRAGVLVLGGSIAAKPAKAGFDEAFVKLSAHAVARGGKPLARSQVVMFGDNYMTDGGSVQAGIAFAKVKPVPTDNSQFRHPAKVFLKRTGQRAMRSYASTVAAVHEGFRPASRRAISADADQ